MTRTRQRRRKDPNVPKNAPLFAMGTALLLTVAGVVVVVTGNGGKNDGSLLVGLVVTTIPSLLAAGYAERTSRDVRNGTVQEKARQGTRQAIEDAGVVTRDGPAVSAAIAAQSASTAALTALLQRVAPELTHNTDLTEAVADALDVPHDDYKRPVYPEEIPRHATKEPRRR